MINHLLIHDFLQLLILKITNLSSSAHAKLWSIPFQELKQALKDLDKCLLHPIGSVQCNIRQINNRYSNLRY